MKHSDVIRSITKQKGCEPTQQELANVLGLTRNAISSRAFRDKEYSYSDIEKIENYYGVSFFNQAFVDDMHDSSGTISVDYYPNNLVIKNEQKLILSTVKEKMHIPKICIADYFPLGEYVVTNAFGDSMQPTIQKQDKLILELIRDDKIKDNHIYVFHYKDSLFCKRLVRNINKIAIISDNPDKIIYPIDFVEYDDIGNVRVIGRVVGLMRSF